MAKDIRTADDLAAAVGVPAPLADSTAALWDEAARSLGSAADHTAVARYVKGTSDERLRGPCLRYAKSGRRDVRENFLNLDPSMDLHERRDAARLLRLAHRGRRSRDPRRHRLQRSRRRGAQAHASGQPRRGAVALRRRADAIQDVVITHLHYDHAGNLDRFPNARFTSRTARWPTPRAGTCATGRFARPCGRGRRHMVRHVYAERVVFHDGEAEIAPGVTLHRVGGHSDGLQVVRVPTRRGPVVIASDAVHLYANMSRQNPFPIVFHLGDMLEGWRTLERLAARPSASCRARPARDRDLPDSPPRHRRGLGPARGPDRLRRQAAASMRGSRPTTRESWRSRLSSCSLASAARSGGSDSTAAPVVRHEPRARQHVRHGDRDGIGDTHERREQARALEQPLPRERPQARARSLALQAFVAEEHREGEVGPARMVEADEGRVGDDVEALLAAIVGMRAPADVGEEARGVAQAALGLALLEALRCR
jgi:glyoxylase-like metal-dependent hydrolase (beta-lactamase superfamily II)